MIRSIRAATIAVAFAAGVTFAAGVAVAQTRPTGGPRVSLPAFGIAFEAPAGWMRVPETSYSHLARFARVEYGQATGVVLVEASPAKGRTADAIAAAFAAERKGEPVKPGAPLPGDAAEIRLPGLKGFPGSGMAVRVVRDQAVIVTVATQSADEVSSTLRAVLDSMRVAEPIPAADDLRPRGRPVPLLGSSVLIALPEPYRPNPVEDPAAQAFFGARDWRSGRDEASIQVQLMNNVDKIPLADVAAQSTANLTSKLQLIKAMTATRINEAPEAFVSSPFTTDGRDLQRIVWTRVDEGRFALLIFRTTAEDADAREKYAAVAETVARAMRVSEDYADARRAATRPAK